MWTRSRGRNGSRRGGRGRGGQFRGGSRGGFHDKPSRPFHRSRGDFKRSDRPTVYNKPQGVIEKLVEVDIGITEYIRPSLDGFGGVLKARYSDFHVNEIDLNGQIAKLSDFSIPVDPEPEPIEEDDEGVVNRYRIEQLPTETWDRIHKMVQNNKKNETVEIDVTTTTKQERTKIHEAIKTVFGHKIVGSTNTKEDKKFITFKKYSKNDRIDMREKWPATRNGEYVYFIVHKVFIDTIEANIQISECLQMRPGNFCYAGVKDRRAKTTQWFCVRKVEPTKILERTRSLKNIYVGNFCYKKETLKLGQLQGNRFRIAIREISASEEVTDKALESLRDNGFINYYGHQRFGNSKEIPTHQVGVQLLRGNWKDAVKLILKPRKYEQNANIAQAKLVYEESGDVLTAIAQLKKNRTKCVEGRLFAGLAKFHLNDFVNALENVPRNMRLLYIHAYQSLVWNTMVSRRIKEFGLKPIVGDIIVEGDLNGSDLIWDTAEEEAEKIDTMKDDTESETSKEASKQLIKVKILTEADLDKYTIYDIVLPLPGYDITYPNNVVKDWYQEYLAKDGLSLDMPKQKVKIYTLSGAYRKIVERVTNMSWRTVGYNDATDNLIRSDFEELKGKPEPKSTPDAKYKAIIVDFCLSSSCYATMALREVMKSSTTWDPSQDMAKKSIAKPSELNDSNEDLQAGEQSANAESENNGNDANSDEKIIDKLEKPSVESISEEKPENPEIIMKIENITATDIDNADKVVIKKEIADLEDDAWNVIDDHDIKVSGEKRKLEGDIKEEEPKKTKQDTESLSIIDNI